MVSLFTLRVSWISLALGTIAMSVLPTGRGEAALITYTRLADFAAATSGRTTNVVNFDSTPLATEIGSFQGLNFGAIPNGNKLWVTDGTPTFGGGLKAFSGTRYLGSDAGELISLGAGQSFTIGFQSNASAIGFYLISNNQLFDDELGFRVGATTVLLKIANEVPLTGGGAVDSFAYFVGIADTNSTGVLSTVTVFPNLPNAASFGIDNITTAVTAVPEPSSMVFAGVILVSGIVRRSLQSNKRSKRN